MKIKSLLEAKFSKPQYAYHATGIENLRSIIKNGLVPNFKEGGYGSDEQSSAGYSLTPLKGVYLTRKAKDALEISKVLETPSGLSAIIICKVQPQQAELDEDRLITSVIDESKFRMLVLRKLEDSADEDLMSEDSFHNMGKEADDFIANYIKNNISTTLTRQIGETAANNAIPYIHKYLRHLVEFIMDTKYGGPHHEHELKQAQNDLTKQLRRLNKTLPEIHHTFKLDTKIGFSGANKIVGIYFPIDRLGWGDLGGFAEHSYHEYNSPVEFYNKAILKYLRK